MAKPFFSIIIPTLNEELYLPRLLQNLSKQTLRNFEVIIVDGESEDNTVRLAKQFIDKLPVLNIMTTSKRNSRYQRNLGAKKARGKFLVLLEADVQIIPEFLEKIYSFISSRQTSFLTTRLATDSSGTIDKLMIIIANRLIRLAKIIGKPFAGGFNTIVRRDIYHRVKGYREDLAISDDHDFAVRVCQAGYELTILKDPHIISSFRRYESSGMFSVLWIYAKANFYFLFKGPVLAKDFQYPMGGHVHQVK